MKRAERFIQIIILFCFIFYSQFYKLNTLTYRIWDEARLATNAYEMTKTGSLFVTTVDFRPDMWSTKPPLMIWAQAVCIKIHGLTEFSTRFPSVLSAAFTILLVFGFVLYITGNGWAALLAGIVLSTARGYIDYHGTRFGEYDSMLTLFTTCYLLFFFLFTEVEREKKNKHLFLFFVSITLAVLTKGIAGLLFSPALLLYLLIRKQLFLTLSNKFFYVGTFGFIIVAFGYYLLREHYNPGYLAAVFENELGGRFMKLNEEHQGPPDFYLSNLRWERFGSWFWAFPLSALLFLFNKNHRQLRVSLFCLLNSALFLAILSSSETKLWWYDLPVYPLLAIFISLTILQLSELAGFIFPFIKKKVALLALILTFSAQPIYEAFQMIRWSGDDPENEFYTISYYLRDAVRQNKDLSNYVYFSSGYDLQWKLYIYALNERGNKIGFEHFNGSNKFETGSKVIAHQSETESFIESNYTFNLIEENRNINLYEITNLKR